MFFGFLLKHLETRDDGFVLELLNCSWRCEERLISTRLKSIVGIRMIERRLLRFEA